MSSLQWTIVAGQPRWPVGWLTLLVLLACLNSGAAPQAERANNGAPSNTLRPGVVLEKFTDTLSGTEQAGMQPGDVLLRWSRDDAHGELSSPFDLYQVVTEQLCRGPVQFEGLRGAEMRTWTVSKQYWVTLFRPNFPDVTLTAYREGARLASEGKLLEAGQRWRSAADDAVQSQPWWVRAWFMLQIADAFAEAQNWKEADAAYAEVIAQVAPLGPGVQAELLTDWADSFMRRSDWKRAEQYALEARAKSQQAGFIVLEAGTYSLMAVNSRGQGDLDKAEQYAREALSIRATIDPNSLITATSFLNLGIIVSDRGNLVAAEDFYRKALAGYQRIAPGSVGEAYILDGLGDLARQRGDLIKAAQYFQQSLTILEARDPGTRPHAIILTDMADVAELGVTSRTPQDFLHQALKIMHKLSPDGSLEEADALEKLGDISQSGGDLTASEQHYLKALAMREKLAPTGLPTAAALNRLGDLSMAGKDFARAEGFYRRALAIREKLTPGSVSHAETLAGLANVKRRSNQLPAAAQYYAQALAALESQTARLGGSSDQRAGFRARHETYYRDYINLLVGQNEIVTAFEVLERSRARTLLEILTAGHVDLRRGADPALLQRGRSLQADIRAKSERRIGLLGGKPSNAEITAIETEISQLISDYGEVEAHILATSPAYAALTQPQPLKAEAVRKELRDSNTLLLEYSLSEERSHVFAVTADSIQAYVLPPRAAIETQARRVYGLLTERNRIVPGESAAQKEQRWSKAESDYASAAAELSRTLLGPVATRIEEKRLIIVADGALHYIPFAALPVPGSSNAQPLATSHEIVSLPAASVVAFLREQAAHRKPAPRTVAVLADPVFSSDDSRVTLPAKTGSQPGAPAPEKLQSSPAHEPGSVPLSAGLLTRSAGDLGLERGGQLSLPRLSYTRMEADAIVAVTPPGLSLEAVDFQASRATAISPELANYRIVHFATHGLLNGQHPELSGLVFSLVDKTGNAQEGFLTLQDIYNLNLPADLVVLSACETALGKEVSGEGLMGLTRGFMHAGATRVVASLWNVSDVATARLMEEFYKAMEKGGLSPAAALRAAQVKMMKQPRWSSPYYWAAFQIQGEWK